MVRAQAVPDRPADPVAEERAAAVDIDRPASRPVALAGLALGTGSSPVGGLALGQPPPAIRRSSEPADLADPLGGTPIPGEVLTALRRRRGAGRPLPSGPAAEIGHSMGPAASGARIHDDPEADRLARSVQSVAFSYGSDVYFTRSSFAPNTERGQHLLAHELTHVTQASAGSSGSAVIGRADDGAERDADRSAASVVGALRRQAARLAALPANPTGTSSSGIARFPAGLETVRRAYSVEEGPTVLALAQVGTEERVTELEVHNWSAADTGRLSRANPPPTYVEMNAIMAKFSWAQARQLGTISNDCAELARLAATSWPAAQIVRLAELEPAPDAAQLLAIPEFFTTAQLRRVWPVCEQSIDNVMTLIGSGWSAANIATMVAEDDNLPTWAQLEPIVTRLTAAQSATLVGAVKVNWENLTRLANAAGPVDQSPAITLRRALVACQSFMDEEIAALNDELGLNVDRRRYAALMIGTDNIQGTNFRVVTDYLRDARYFSICFDTARRLLTELGNVAGDESGGAVDATYPVDQQGVRSALLIQHLTAASQGGAPTIFDIHVGGHGFTLTVIGDAVYQLEAFASQAGVPNENPQVLANYRDLDMSLLTSIGANRTYTLAAITTALGQMTSDQVAERRAGAGTMGWNAGPCGFTAGDAIADPMAIWWKSSSLLSNAGIVVRLAQRVQRQAAEIRAMFGVDARAA